MKNLTRYFHHVCTIYTISVLLLLLANAALGSSPQKTTFNTAAFLWLFVFAALFAAVNRLLRVDGIPYPARVVLHCLFTVGGAFCLLYLPNQAGAAASGKLMMLLLMLVVYWIVMALYLLLAPHKGKADTCATAGKEKEEYKSLFGSGQGR
jgi:hypothetical protein